MLQREDLRRDVRALRRHLWFPAAAVLVALAAAAALGLVAGAEDRAEFRLRVEPIALPPLFGPPTLPGPADFAAFATSAPVLEATATQLRDENIAGADALASRLSASPRPNQPSIDFTVRGEHALAVAEAWRDQFMALLPASLPELERQVTSDYALQLEQARNELMSRQAEAASGDVFAEVALAAARENYQVAERLAQSYEVVGQTMKATVAQQERPHLTRSGPLDWSARLGAALAFGLMVGVIGTAALEAWSRRRAAAEGPTEPVYETSPPPP